MQNRESQNRRKVCRDIVSIKAPFWCDGKCFLRPENDWSKAFPRDTRNNAHQDIKPSYQFSIPFSGWLTTGLYSKASELVLVKNQNILVVS